MYHCTVTYAILPNVTLLPTVAVVSHASKHDVTLGYSRDVTLYVRNSEIADQVHLLDVMSRYPNMKCRHSQIM